MNEKALRILIRANILMGLNTRGFSDVLVLRAFQPTQQGQPNERAVYMHEVYTRPHGSPKSSTKYNSTTGEREKIDVQQQETRYQFSATVNNDSDDMAALTPYDLLNTVRAVVQYEDFQNALALQDVGVMRIVDMFTPKRVDDRDQFRTEPTFDVIFTHKDSYTVTPPKVTGIETNLIGVNR